MILPLFFMARRDYGIARELLSTRSCNCEGKRPAWRELLQPRRQRGVGWLLRHVRCLARAAAILPYTMRGRKKDADAFRLVIERLARHVRVMDVTPPRSAYSTYYDEKKEALALDDPSGFPPKQRAVNDVLRARAPRTVLDVGANTGWYSVLAARLGASVIALEEDESCADILYGRAKRHGLRILPLKVSFGDLTKEIHGSPALASAYRDRGVGVNPLYRAGIERLGGDLALVLGLLHHLVLGEGRSLDEVFGILTKLAARTLVVEFVALDDEKIREEPGFFPNLRKFDASTYNLEIAMQAGRRHFSTVEVRASHPASRTILVFDR
jgi:SAM-dependent methyltransferase